MIESHEELTIIRKQLDLAERALIDLHRKLGSKNHRNYRLYGESAIDIILELRAQIDDFLGIAPSQVDDNANTTANGSPAASEPVKS